jgi:exonuclease SbcC
VTDQIEQLSNFDSSPLIKQQKLCQSELEQKGQDQLQLTNVIEQLKLDMASLQAKLAMLSGDNDNPVISLATLHHEFQELEQNIQQLKQQEAALARKLKQQENQLTVVTTQIASAQQELAQWQQQLIHDQQSWQSALESSPFTVAEEYIAARLQPEQREQLEAEITQYELTLARLESQLEQLNSELAQSELPDLSESEQRVQQVQQQVEQALEAVTAFQSQFDAFHQAQSRLTIVRKKNQALEQRYQVIGTLSDVANGKNHLRVSLHRFVLGVLLDDVLIQASTRLQRMSHGRYRLIRKIERSKGNASSGLELLVEDSYTSKCRDVATLSGGESFIAALSLALALSDVVQAHSGGIRLDTLFIDEGFGSLDAESLDLAIQTLIDLQKGGRTIGIISHVNELKEQMECRIDIKRDRSGSMISLVS